MRKLLIPLLVLTGYFSFAPAHAAEEMIPYLPHRMDRSHEQCISKLRVTDNWEPFISVISTEHARFTSGEEVVTALNSSCMHTVICKPGERLTLGGIYPDGKLGTLTRDCKPDEPLMYCDDTPMYSRWCGNPILTHHKVEEKVAAALAVVPVPIPTKQPVVKPDCEKERREAVLDQPIQHIQIRSYPDWYGYGFGYFGDSWGAEIDIDTTYWPIQTGEGFGCNVTRRKQMEKSQ